MEKQTCKDCGKEIEGYSKKHVDFLMAQHRYVHIRKSKEAKEEKQ